MVDMVFDFHGVFWPNTNVYSGRIAPIRFRGLCYFGNNPNNILAAYSSLVCYLLGLEIWNS